VTTPPSREPKGSRDALLATAMELFAHEGIDAVSVRAVNRAAGLAAAAVHYHFGSKQALLDAAIQLHGADVLGEIERRCERLLASDIAPTPRALVDAFADPYFRLLERQPASGRNWLSIIAQLTLTHDDRLTALAEPVTERLEAVTSRVFPDAPIELVRTTLPVALITFIQMVAPHDHRDYLDHDSATALVEFVTGGLTAVLRNGLPPAAAMSVA
jgi:AcrR family transcriptional regulator